MKRHEVKLSQQISGYLVVSITLFAVILFSACAPGPITTPTSTSSLPDLAISNMYLGMQGVPTNRMECIPAYGPLEIRAMIRNLGQATVNNITVIELSSGTKLTVEELGAGLGMELNLPITSAKATYNIVVDPQNTITESDEDNNNFSYFAITPTPPLLCTPTSAPSTTLSTLVPEVGSESRTLSRSVLMNGTYHSSDWGEYQLVDGVYYRTPPTTQESPESYTTRIQDPVFYGDINADGLEDSLVFLNTQNGGTGHFIELAAVLDQNGSAYNVSTVYLGDRVVVESGKVENGTIVLNMRVQGPNDGLCCPSQLVTWSFVLNDNQLMKLP